MPRTLDPDLRRALAERIRYCHEMGVYDFYRREAIGAPDTDSGALAMTDIAMASSVVNNEYATPDEMAPKRTISTRSVIDENTLYARSPWPEQGTADPAAALKIIRQDLGECTRCKLHSTRNKIVFGVGDPNAELLFVGEGPGADEDAQGEPFVGRAGQLLNNMIKAMGLRREDVYIANIVKCRPPANRQPERDESETCSPFLMRQIAAIKPKVIVALGATAAKGLLALSAPMTELRGRWYDFRPAGSDPSWPGSRLAVTYHPAFLLRDPRQKGEAWKDLQMVMKYLGIVPPPKAAQ